MRNFNKKPALLIIAITAIVILVYLKIWSKRTEMPQAIGVKSQNPATRSTNAGGVVDLRYNSYGQISLRNQNVSGAVHEANRRDSNDPKSAWKTPMNFFGKVVDEKGMPIEGASVTFLRTDLTPTGTTETNSTSDTQGLFALEGVQGKRLKVSVNKTGYQALQDQIRTSFEFADPADAVNDQTAGHKIIYYEPDPSRPFQFQLRKKGNPAVLIKKSLGFALYGDGRAKSVDFFTGHITSLDGKQNMEQMEVNGWMPWPARPPVPHYDWRLLFSIPDGGFVKSEAEFEPVAPTVGYQPTLDVDMRATMIKGWRDGMEADYFFAFGTPRVYGHMHIRATILNRSLYIDYILNPQPNDANLEE